MAEDKLKLAKAAVMPPRAIPDLTIWSSGEDNKVLNKFQFPKDYNDIVKLCNYFYRTDPIVSNTINKILDIGFKGYYLNRSTCTDEEYQVYSSINDEMLDNLRELGLEYLLSGLVVPDVTWHTIAGEELHSDLSSKVYEVPEVLWKRDPTTILLKSTPIPKRVAIYVVPNEEDIYFIKEKGKYSDGTEDKETYELLKEEYPDYVRRIKNGEIKFKLEDPFLIRRNPLDDSPYPTPYLLPALEPLTHKRNLRKMDYAIASRVIAAILLFRLGSDEFPLTEDDDDQVSHLRNQMLWRGRSDSMERIFQLFANHTLQIDWIMPEVTALLDEKKYGSVNTDILFALGFPRIILTGETARTGTSSSEFALLSPAETIKAIRENLLKWPKYIYKEIKKRNKGFKGLPEPVFSEIRLYDLQKLMTIIDKLYERGAVSKTTYARLGGFDFENIELPLRIHESELIKEAKIEEFPLQPFTEQAPNKNDGIKKQENNSNDQDTE